jgi:hypothetical protein
MPKLLSWIDRRYWVYQPNFTRHRHRFRGVRESEKVNQEIVQYYYDLKRVELMNATTYDSLEDYEDSIVDGAIVDDLLYNWYGDDVVTDEPLVLLGTTDLAARLETLRKRIGFLENNRL